MRVSRLSSRFTNLGLRIILYLSCCAALRCKPTLWYREHRDHFRPLLAGSMDKSSREFGSLCVEVIVGFGNRCHRIDNGSFTDWHGIDGIARRSL